MGAAQLTGNNSHPDTAGEEKNRSFPVSRRRPPENSFYDSLRCLSRLDTSHCAVYRMDNIQSNESSVALSDAKVAVDNGGRRCPLPRARGEMNGERRIKSIKPSDPAKKKKRSSHASR
jgi:hypothetical protein